MNTTSQKSDPIADLFDIKARYLRSANLERDFDDPESLKGYAPTDHGKAIAQRLVAGLRENSGQRAWRITGDYGSGKSSFALCLANIFAGRDSMLPVQVRRIIDFRAAGLRRPGLVPVLLTGTREKVSIAILRALKETLSDLYTKGAKSGLLRKIEDHLARPETITDDLALDVLQETRNKLICDRKGDGILVIIDELGKFLEFAVFHPLDQDIYFFQRLAEMACRSKNQPLFVVGLLHQGFSAYADTLSQSAQREWQKVAERFEEVLFNQPLDQIATLITSALGVKIDRLSKAAKGSARDDMRATIGLGWFGFGASQRLLVDQSPSLYPLHPTILPLLVRVFSRFGQNERSLFSFLLSNEPFGLQWFAQKSREDAPFYRLADLYDYVRSTFGHRLAFQSYRTHWSLIESMIESFATDKPLELIVLKTIGLINLLNANEFAPTAEALTLAIAGNDAEMGQKVKATLHSLHSRGVLYNRGQANGYSLWPYTSVDLDKKYQEASTAIGSITKVGKAIERYLEVQPIVARRHYIQTGNLRHFDVHYCSTSELAPLLKAPVSDADGRIIVPLCETEEERSLAILFAQEPEIVSQRETLVAIPEALSGLAGLVEELWRWEWISAHTPELNSDQYARQEVLRQRNIHQQALMKRIENFVGLRSLNGRLSLLWYREGEKEHAGTGRELLTLLSRICDDRYSSAPKIKNEMVNRRGLSASGAAARLRLIERIFTHPGSELLGMEATKKPPEMAIYLSVLRKAGLHRLGSNGWEIALPARERDACWLTPLFNRLEEIVRRQPDGRVKVSDIFAELRQPPFGARDGILPLLLAVFAAVHRNDIAFYDNGTFLREVRGEEFRLLTKQPESFEIQYCKIDGMRADLFDRLREVLGGARKLGTTGELLDVVRPLCVLVAQLPTYAHNTRRISEKALAVRGAVLAARDPLKLLFRELPAACGIPTVPGKDFGQAQTDKFVEALKGALDELRAAYPDLQTRMQGYLGDALNTPKRGEPLRALLAERADRLIVHVAEATLKTFCLRLGDTKLSIPHWLESLGSYLTSKPPSKWMDADEDRFAGDLLRVVGRFQRVESAAFTKVPRPEHAEGVRLAVTHADGGEREEVLYFTPEEEAELRRLQQRLSATVFQNKRLGLVAASRMIWETLSRKEHKEN